MTDKHNGRFLDPHHDEIDEAYAAQAESEATTGEKWWQQDDPKPHWDSWKNNTPDVPAVKTYKETMTYASKVNCHFGAKLAFTDPKSGCKFYGGGTSRSVFFPKGAILVDLAGYFGKPPYEQLSFYRIKEKSLSQYSHNPHITIDWPDMKTPYLDPDFWPELLKTIRKFKKNVLFFCVGGHGRTGTALAIMAQLTGAAKHDPVAMIRSIYCTHAIETKDQEEYIQCAAPQKK